VVIAEKFQQLSLSEKQAIEQHPEQNFISYRNSKSKVTLSGNCQQKLEGNENQYEEELLGDERKQATPPQSTTNSKRRKEVQQCQRQQQRQYWHRRVVTLFCCSMWKFWKDRKRVSLGLFVPRLFCYKAQRRRKPYFCLVFSLSSLLELFIFPLIRVCVPVDCFYFSLSFSLFYCLICLICRYED